ncbi:MAG: hypothetical protein M1832_005327 [Thelocarpon impressellum]|nr:MAG: hypothetical protein M1832_005327 [Thelocarpon impressellum]
MVPKRSLPKEFNPLLQPESSPPFDDLVERRRLGQTNLAVKPGQIGTSNATKPENLGVFDYAHLRAPLPKDLHGSGIFVSQIPESYFLMRRSTDGYISATGMFKASFPWADVADEETERKYIKSLPTTSTDETAGNVWIPPHFALKLAEEYKIALWVRALLDPAPIDKGSSDPKKSISPPPTFVVPEHISFQPPHSTPGRGRGGRQRSGSPAKNASPNKKTASPRKRATKAAHAAHAAHASAASATLQTALNNAATAAESRSQAGEDGEKVRVEVDSAVETNGTTETTHTNVKVELPAGSAELPLPDSTEEMLNTAKKMVEEARKIDGKGGKGGKRKAEGLPEEDEADAVQPAKKARVLEDELKREKVKTKALLGLSATLAIGYGFSRTLMVLC